LTFEAYFSTKNYVVTVEGIADFPEISTISKNIYWNCKKTRPASPPDSYLSKVYVISEKIFDFGPLLIGKNPANKMEPAIKNINSTTFRITN